MELISYIADRFSSQGPRKSNEFEQCKNAREVVSATISAASFSEGQNATQKVFVGNPKAPCFQKLVSELRNDKWDVSHPPSSSIHGLRVDAIMDQVTFHSEFLGPSDFGPSE